MEHSRISDKTQHEMGKKISIYSLTRVQLKLFFFFLFTAHHHWNGEMEERYSLQSMNVGRHWRETPHS